MNRRQTHLTPDELEHFRQILLDHRQQVQDELAELRAEQRESVDANNVGSGLSSLPTHPADQGTDVYEQDLTSSMILRQQSLLEEINQALQRIRDGTYGICEGTGKRIAKVRLRAKPWTRYSFEYAKEVHSA